MLEGRVRFLFVGLACCFQSMLPRQEELFHVRVCRFSPFVLCLSILLLPPLFATGLSVQSRILSFHPSPVASTARSVRWLRARADGRFSAAPPRKVLFLLRTRGHLLGRMGAVDTATPDATAALFEIRAHPAGFLGAFATRSISAGTLVLDDSPLFTLDAPLQAYLFQRVQAGGGGGPTPVEGDEDEEDDSPPTDFDDFLERNIKTVLSWKSEEQRKQFWDLANTRVDLPPAYGIFATNAVQLVPFPFSPMLHCLRSQGWIGILPRMLRESAPSFSRDGC